MGQYRTEAKCPAHLICKRMITAPLPASATWREKMGKILHKWLPKSSRVYGIWIQRYQLWTSKRTGIRTRGYTIWEAFTEPATRTSRREFWITEDNQNKGSVLLHKKKNLVTSPWWYLAMRPVSDWRFRARVFPSCDQHVHNGQEIDYSHSKPITTDTRQILCTTLHGLFVC